MTYTPTEQANIELIQRMYAADNAHDPVAYCACLAADVEVFGNGALLRAGRESQASHLRDNYTAFPDGRTETLRLLADGDFVVAGWRRSGTHMGPYGGFPATGNHLELFGTSTFEIRRGEVRRHWVDVDTGLLMRTLRPEA